jgi:hypothetical protein
VKLHRVLLLTLLTAALCGLAVSAAGVVSRVLPRRFSATQQHQIEAWEIGGRWRALPANAIFPAAVPYRLAGSYLYSNNGLGLTARRLGVSGSGPCAKGADPAAARILGRHRCSALLRATYTDSTGSMVATVGVAVLPGDAAAAKAEDQLAAERKGGQPDGVAPAPVAGTLASRFDDDRRQLNMNSRAGPYLILATVGYADGRPHVRISADSYLQDEMSSLAQGLSDTVMGALDKPPRSPTCPGAPGC